jgi:hypothetical protein
MTGGKVIDIEVTKYDRWQGYRGGQLYSFHCITTLTKEQQENGP